MTNTSNNDSIACMEEDGLQQIVPDLGLKTLLLPLTLGVSSLLHSPLVILLVHWDRELVEVHGLLVEVHWLGSVHGLV